MISERGHMLAQLDLAMVEDLGRPIEIPPSTTCSTRHPEADVRELEATTKLSHIGWWILAIVFVLGIAGFFPMFF
jgi:hypothetical protein